MRGHKVTLKLGLRVPGVLLLPPSSRVLTWAATGKLWPRPPFADGKIEVLYVSGTFREVMTDAMYCDSEAAVGCPTYPIKPVTRQFAGERRRRALRVSSVAPPEDERGQDKSGQEPKPRAYCEASECWERWNW